MSVKLSMFLLINICLSVILFMFQISVANIGTEEGIININNVNFDYNGSAIKGFETNGEYYINGTIDEVINTIQTEDAEVDQDEGNWFTDTFKTVKNWLLESTGIKWVLGVLNAVPNFISSLFGETYSIYAFGLNVIWYVSTIFAVIFWLKGGGQ